MITLNNSELRILVALVKRKQGEVTTLEELGRKTGLSSSGAHRALMRLVQFKYIKMISIPGRRTRYEVNEEGRKLARAETAHDRLARFFREERPDLGWEGDVEGWDPVQCAIENLRRKPRPEEVNHG